MLSALLAALVMTPLDLITFNQVQARLYGGTALRKISARMVARDVFRIEGIGFIWGMTFGSSLVRYFFVMTSMNSLDNYARSMLITRQIE